MKYYFALFIGLFAIQLHAQISGSVLDAENELPLEYATVALYHIDNEQELVTGVVTILKSKS